MVIDSLFLRPPTLFITLLLSILVSSGWPLGLRICKRPAEARRPAGAIGGAVVGVGYARVRPQRALHRRQAHSVRITPIMDTGHSDMHAPEWLHITPYVHRPRAGALAGAEAPVSAVRFCCRRSAAAAPGLPARRTRTRCRPSCGRCRAARGPVDRKGTVTGES